MKIISILMVAVICYACSSSDSEPTPTPSETLIVTVTMDGSYQWQEQVYASITDSKGKTLACKKLHTSDNQFKGDAPDVINLTIFHFFEGPEQSHYNFVTHPNVPLSSKFMVSQSRGSTYSPPPITGSAKVIVNNYKNPAHSYPTIFISDGFRSAQINDPLAQNSITVDLHLPYNDLLASAYDEVDKPVYKWAEDVASGNEVTLDFNDFMPYENTIALPEAYYILAYVRGIQTIGGKRSARLFSSLNFYHPENLLLKSRLGYMQGYEQYEISVYTYHTISNSMGKSSHYRNLGTAIDSVIFPAYNFTLTDEKIESFKFDYSDNSQFQSHAWGYNEGGKFINWSIYSDGTTVVPITEFPAEIKSTFPFLDFNKLKFSSSSFYECTDGYSYQNYFNDLAKGNHTLLEKEYIVTAFHKR